MYLPSIIHDREDKRNYEVFHFHTREQFADSMTKEKAELLCKMLNDLNPLNNLNPASRHVPMASVTVIKNEEQYTQAIQRLQELMQLDIPKGSPRENDIELLQVVLEKYENDMQELENELPPAQPVRLIKTEKDYAAATNRINELMDIDFPKDSPLADEFELLTLVIQDYESQITETNRAIEHIEVLRDQFAMEAMKIYLADGLQKSTNALDGYRSADMHNISVLSYALADTMIDNRDN